MIDHYRSGVGGNIHVEAGFLGDTQVHIAGPGADAPKVLGSSVASYVAAAGFGAKSAIDAAHDDITGAGTDVDVTLAHFFDFDVAATGFDSRGAGELASAHIAGAGLESEIAGQTRELHVPRSSLQVDIALETFHRLIAAATVAANRRVFRNGDLVVDGDVAQVHVINTNVVTVLPERRILLKFVHVRFVATFQPGITLVDLAVNRYRVGRTVADGDVTGAGKNLEIDRSIDLERAVESTDHRCEAG